MYPKVLEEASRAYFFDEEYFKGDLHFVHTYLHTDCRYGMHSHQFHEINIIAAGQGRHYIENTSMHTKAGDVFVIPPWIKHGFFSEEPLDIYLILIKSDFLERYAKELYALEGFNILFDIEPQIRCASGKNFNLNLGYKEFDSVEAELKKMINAEKKARFVYQNALLLTLLCRLCERISGHTSLSNEKTEIVTVMEHIKNNLDQKLTLDSLAKFANMSKATLNRQFTKTVGLSPMTYVLKKRVARARELIGEGAKNKTEIAQLCGFYDISHMNKYLQ